MRLFGAVYSRKNRRPGRAPGPSYLSRLEPSISPASGRRSRDRAPSPGL